MAVSPPTDRWYAIDSPVSGVSGAPGTPIAILRVESTAAGIDEIITELGWRGGAIGSLVVRATGGDEVLLARSSPTTVFLMPLGSPIVVDALARALESAGCARRADTDPRARYPEARDLVEACALDTIARAASPRAIDALLRQRDLWARVPPAPMGPHPNPLDHLIVPPRIVVIGRPNIGKSSLLNALARRAVAIAADEPGTTRDHIGAEVECDGLMVRWIDTPGIPRPGDTPGGSIDRIAADRARALVEGANLVLLASDIRSGDVERGELGTMDDRVPVIRIGLRADLGVSSPPPEVVTSVRTGQGVAELGRRIRRALVPDDALASPSRWRFHPFLPGA